MSKYGPTRNELWFRIYVSVAGLLLMIGGILYRGLPAGPVMIETIGIASAFFGGTLIWTLRKLMRKDYSDAP
ncbi:hypothetical protein [uncultured Roseobacter sp.]|uniref:hypothetical protein n=1 Tax=uncultured Roseobacter sp. TaxID=114847 RepID=UPI0026336088|nr:hypothetical protein [uncultured Roseobacter sp.]